MCSRYGLSFHGYRELSLFFSGFALNFDIVLFPAHAWHLPNYTCTHSDILLRTRPHFHIQTTWALEPTRLLRIVSQYGAADTIACHSTVCRLDYKPLIGCNLWSEFKLRFESIHKIFGSSIDRGLIKHTPIQHCLIWSCKQILLLTCDVVVTEGLFKFLCLSTIFVNIARAPSLALCIISAQVICIDCHLH